MTPKQSYYQAVSQTVVKNFQKRGFECCYCQTKEEGFQKAMSYIKSGDVVGNGGTMTLEDMGFFEKLKQKNDINYLDRMAVEVEKRRDVMIQSLNSDVFFMSTNAFTLGGELVNIDGTGNRVGALVFGPKSVVIVVGMNKLETTLEGAMNRAKTYASPMNAHRLSRNTPCYQSGMCANCLEDECICNHTVITRRSNGVGRIKVILVGDELGY